MKPSGFDIIELLDTTIFQETHAKKKTKHKQIKKKSRFQNQSKDFYKFSCFLSFKDIHRLQKEINSVTENFQYLFLLIFLHKHLHELDYLP